MLLNIKKFAGGLAVAAVITTSAPSFALSIKLSDTGNVAANNGFRKAADIWESIFKDDVTVNIASGFASLGQNIIGQAGSAFIGSDYAIMKAALGADAASAADAVMVAGLPAGESYSKLINGTWESAYFYGNQGYTQSGVQSVQMTRANAKAMGLIAGDDVTIDGEITFSSDFNFDFDSSDGISMGSMDFIGVALHEIGHALGFVSGVDVLDYYSYFEGAIYSDAAYSPFATPLDFTRCSDESEAKGADIDWTAGSGAKHFAINGQCASGARVDNAWSTGSFQGDGQQASHWRDNAGLGILDPTAGYGEFLQISQLDLFAFDVIGWDLEQKNTSVPESSCLVLLSAALLGLGAMRRRRVR